MPNSLIHESSPYLLQHAQNPVNWYAWNESSLSLAKEQNKLILLSIGYSACHWCHVMERECFEDAGVADLMNRHFISIKVDREERPDIDQVYMTAVQVMSGRGGWPLNCILLPDGRPVYGGTYFPRTHWIDILLQLAELWIQRPGEAAVYAQKLTDGIRQAELITPMDNTVKADTAFVHEAVKNWRKHFDLREGGPDRHPKFPLPNNYSFLFQYAVHTKADDEAVKSGKIPDPEDILAYVQLTLDKMCRGGIYDHVGGGFARYSTDTLWKVPHFEKMLYDNAQLISLYAEVMHYFPRAEYEQTLRETIAFCIRELRHPSGAFFSALDADSEGEEGKFYTWTREELERLLGDDFSLFSRCFNINSLGEWEDRYIPLRKQSLSAFASANQLDSLKFRQKASEWKNLLLMQRNKRMRPGLDDKCIASWNALMVSALCSAYHATTDISFLVEARKTAVFLQTNLMKPGGGMYHTWKDGKAGVNAFLDDLACTAEAFLKLYESNFDEKWLEHAEALINYALEHHSDTAECFFYFTSDLDPPLLVRNIELHDNVIPASNSIMAHVLMRAAIHLDRADWRTRAQRMISSIQEGFAASPSGHSNWMKLCLFPEHGPDQVIIVGNSVDDFHAELRKKAPLHLIFAGSRGPSSLPLLKNRFREGKTLVYVCRNGSCGIPAESPADALVQLGFLD